MGCFRCRSEFQFLSSLQHPCLVTGLAYLWQGNQFAIIMTFHPGQTLTRAISQGAFHEKQSRRLFAQLLSAIGYLHQRSIVHCDVKAENIILSFEGSNLTLVDFGAARSLEQSAAPEICSPKYAAPEAG